MLKPFFRPLHPFSINQRFGENQSCVSTDGSNKVITCDGMAPPPGYRSLYGPKGHKGLDLMAKSGQPVYCVCDGEVEYMDTQERSGLDARIVSVINGEKYRHIYEHLLGHNNLKIGQRLKTGDCVGWADNTGYSSGDHLHFELQKFTNGIWISIDPLPLMNEYFAPNVTLVKGIMEKLVVALESLVDLLRKRG